MKSYLITDPSFFGHDPKTLSDQLAFSLTRHPIDFALFRHKQTPHYSELSETFIDVCRKHAVSMVLLHADYRLAHALGADGVHLTSMQFDEIADAKKSGLYVIISTHTHDEALLAQQLGADAITYSPVFASPNKGKPKGLEDLKEIVDKIRIPIFALGGILTEGQISAVEECGAYGFASIRYFIS
ncbi:MAG TPA: thiamine phosphate synthase [Sulfuricurvum sp.]|nr:thiamine phosphate synthase [Sulfuricurvum sp.]